MTFDEIESFMRVEFNSYSRQIQVLHNLEYLRLDSFMVENSITKEQEGLTQMISSIDVMVPQCPPAFRSDDKKISYLR